MALAKARTGRVRGRRASGSDAGGATYFSGPEAFRRYLAGNHARARELVVGFHKKDSLLPSLTWQESVDEALCFGWIDGVRRRVDGARYTIRFTPRRPGSTWSAVNIARARELERLGRMHPAGLEAFRARSSDRSAIAAYEQRRAAALSPAQEARLRADSSAWAFWSAQPPSYRRLSSHWVASAKQEQTRQKRLAILLSCCALGEPIPPLRWAGKGARPATPA